MTNEKSTKKNLYSSLRRYANTYVRLRQKIKGNRNPVKEAILPSKNLQESLSRQEISLRSLSRLVVNDDAVNVLSLRNGFVVAKTNAIKIDGESYDFAVAHMPQEMKVQSFYNIPVLVCPSDDTMAIVTSVFNKFCGTGRRRYFVKTSKTVEPYLVDIDLEDPPSIAIVPYLRSDHRCSTKEAREKGMACIDRLRKELGFAGLGESLEI